MLRHLVVAGAVLGAVPSLAAAQATYAQVADIPVAGALPAQWDYTTPDSASKRVYVSHGTEVVVIDSETNQVVGRIADTPGVHGIAVGAGQVFVSAGRENRVVVADPKTLATLVKIDSGGANPDAITFDPASGHVWVFNHTGMSATEIDAASHAVVATIPLSGTAESGQADGAGHVFVNIEDKDQIDVVDSAARKVTAHWPVSPGSSPTACSSTARRPAVRRRGAGHADDGQRQRQRRRRACQSAAAPTRPGTTRARTSPSARAATDTSPWRASMATR